MTNYDWKDITRRCVFNTKKKKGTENWVHVMSVCGVGSTSAKEICVLLNIEPFGVSLHG